MFQIWDIYEAGQQLVVQEVWYDPLDEFTTLGSSSLPEVAHIMCKFVDIVNSYIEHELFHCRDISQVTHSYEITQTKFLSWGPLHEPFSIIIKCLGPDDLSKDGHVAFHVFKKLYLEPLLYSYSSIMHSTTVSKGFDKESMAWRSFKGRMQFLKEVDGTLGGDSFVFLPSFHNAYLYMYN